MGTRKWCHHEPVSVSRTTLCRTMPGDRRPFSKISSDVVAVVGFAALVAAYFWFIAAFGSNTIWEDQWSDLTLIQQRHIRVTSPCPALWAQHNENRILFPNLVVLLLPEVTHFNVKTEEFLSGLTLVGTTAVVILGHRRRSPGTPWILYVPRGDRDALLRPGTTTRCGAFSLLGTWWSWR